MGAILSLTIATPCDADELDLDNATILFREDFGGNSPSDPVYVTSDTLGSVTTLISQPNFPLACTWSIYDSYDTGCYDVRKFGFPRANSGDWYKNFDDHTSPKDKTRGYIMQVDMGTNAATFYSTQIDRLCSNTKLYLSMWGHPVNVRCDANIKLIVKDLNGNWISSEIVTIDHNNNSWQQVGTYFTVPEGQSSVIFEIYSAGGNGGNDFALDDIEVRLCKPAVKVNTPDSLCIGSNYTLTATYDNSDASYIEPLNFTWYKNESNSYGLDGWSEVGSGSKLDLTDLSENAYYKVIVSSAGVPAEFTKCNASSDNIPILVKSCECTSVTTTIKDTLCEGESYKLGTDSYDATGTYKYTTLKVDGCDSTVKLELEVSAAPVIEDIAPDGDDYKIIYIEKSEDSPYTLCVDNDCAADGYISGKDYGVHQITLTNKNGCKTTQTFTVKSDSSTKVEIEPMPYFTPNEDGINDRWEIKNIEELPDAIIKIFDRWGKLLVTFSPYDNMEHAWDGRYNGNKMPSTDYWYTISSDSIDQVYSGHFTLIR